jgi:putative endonuclease
MRYYYVYILASIQRVLYIGVTNDLEKRLASHRSKQYPRSFTATYNVDRLVYTEEYTETTQAIAREKQLKGWRRGKKVRLIERENPEWLDRADTDEL